MAHYNLLDMIVPSKCIDDATRLLDLIYSKKVEYYQSQDDKGREKLLAKDPNYTSTVGYSELIPFDSFRKVSLQAWFQELADEYGLRTRNGKQVIVNDGAILSHFAFCGESYVKSVRKGQDVVETTQVPDSTMLKGMSTKSKKYPVKWVVVQEDYRRPVFMLASKFVELRHGSIAARGVLAGNVTAMDKKANDSVSVEEHERLLKQIVKLREENMALSERTPVESLH